MSVSRNALRMIATGVASAALVGSAAMPALADGGHHHRGDGYGDRFGHSQGFPSFRGHHRDGDYDRFGYWDRGRYYRWQHRYDRERMAELLRLLAMRHGWHGYHHGHYWDR
ncbi:hypothetical protein AB0C59_34765 [Streptomyces sp. NPDC048664]|uniref:hypothetical protein n=1 Tax=Streptomyces sp. NPDC048664 TaxID=3154505 RepID=UPI0034452CB2